MTEVPPQRRPGQDAEAHAAAPSSRRGFLGGLLAASGLLVATGDARAAAPRSLLPERRLAIVHPHAAEGFSGTYFADGRYLPEQMARIRRILRDHSDGSMPELDARLVDLMARMQSTLDTSEPLQIVSGYRSPATNARARRHDGRVARNSLHMHGQAVDIRVRGRSLSQLRRAALSLQGGGVGTYPNRDFVHIDVGPVRSWG
ncbi:MAG: YcbK family protein [Alphaproteobacteria bacterium]